MLIPSDALTDPKKPQKTKNSLRVSAGQRTGIGDMSTDYVSMVKY